MYVARFLSCGLVVILLRCVLSTCRLQNREPAFISQALVRPGPNETSQNARAAMIFVTIELLGRVIAMPCPTKETPGSVTDCDKKRVLVITYEGEILEAPLDSQAANAMRAIDSRSMKTIGRVDPGLRVSIDFACKVHEGTAPALLCVEHVKSEDVATHYVIYKQPLDYPDHFVLRRWLICRGNIRPDGSPLHVGTLEECRSTIPQELDRLDRSPGDDPSILEVWI